MKPRSILTASEVAQLQELLDRKLERTGVESQPEVVLRLLDLSSNPEAQIHDYAEAIKVDHGIAGRVLRLANASCFGQRSSVTKLDRACLVLGVERLKAITLGFHLSSAASAGDDKSISRQVWGESVFRACMCAESAKTVAPALVSEAFVIGLLMDAGIALMPKLAGPGYLSIYAANRSPGALFRRENESLPFTHVDVVGALARRWRLPELLTRPLEWHHTRPPEGQRDDPTQRLHRIAFVVGLLDLSKRPPQSHALLESEVPGLGTAQRLMNFAPAEMARVVQGAVKEYGAIIEFFADIAAGVEDMESLCERVQVGMVSALDRGLEESFRVEEQNAPLRLSVNGQSVEVVRERDGSAVAYLYDSRGERLIAHRFEPGAVSPESLSEAFGLDLRGPGDLERLRSYVTGKAA